MPTNTEAPERIWIAPVAFRARSASAIIYDEAQREPTDVEYVRADSREASATEDEDLAVERCEKATEGPWGYDLNGYVAIIDEDE